MSGKRCHSNLPAAWYRRFFGAPSKAHFCLRVADFYNISRRHGSKLASINHVDTTSSFYELRSVHFCRQQLLLPPKSQKTCSLTLLSSMRVQNVILTERLCTSVVTSKCLVKPEVSGSLTLLAPIAEIRVPAHAWFTLRCTAIGYPLPGIRWTLDGQPIGDGSSEEEPYAVSNGGLTLTVKNFTLKRAVFECLAENRAGTANETFVVATLG